MLIKRFMFVLLLFSINLSAGELILMQDEQETGSMNKIRNDFYLAVDDGDMLDDLIGYIENFWQSDSGSYPAVIQAYYGALETLKAKHSYNPYNKFRYVIAGLKKLNSAVDKAPDMLEVRFLRFAVLHNIPGIFGITDERNQDLRATYEQLIKMDYSSIGRELQKGVVEFILRSGRLDNLQADRLKNIFPDAIIN